MTGELKPFQTKCFFFEIGFDEQAFYWYRVLFVISSLIIILIAD